MILCEGTAPNLKVWHAEQCRVVRMLAYIDLDRQVWAEVPMEPIRYLVFCPACGGAQPDSNEFQAKKITVNKELTLAIINPIEGVDDGDETHEENGTGADKQRTEPTRRVEVREDSTVGCGTAAASALHHVRHMAVCVQRHSVCRTSD